MKVKMITDYHENIEEQINKFLQENKDSIDVVDIKWYILQKLRVGQQCSLFCFKKFTTE